MIWGKNLSYRALTLGRNMEAPRPLTPDSVRHCEEGPEAAAGPKTVALMLHM